MYTSSTPISLKTMKNSRQELMGESFLQKWSKLDQHTESSQMNFKTYVNEHLQNFNLNGNVI